MTFMQLNLFAQTTPSTTRPQLPAVVPPPTPAVDRQARSVASRPKPAATQRIPIPATPASGGPNEVYEVDGRTFEVFTGEEEYLPLVVRYRGSRRAEIKRLK